MERKPLMYRVKRMFVLSSDIRARKMEHESCSRAPVRVHTRLPALRNGTRLEGGTGGTVTSSSLPVSNLCAPWARLQCFV